MSNVVPFPWRPKRIDHEESRHAAERAIATPAAERATKAEQLCLEDPELLLSICEVLRSQLETSPASVRHDAEFFHTFIEQSSHPIGIHDERDYLLGELALTAGTASRFLFKIEDAKAWLHRAEASFSLVQNANAHWARVAYQRLALAIEERKTEEVLELAPRWANTFRRLDMVEDALKCRFLEGLAHSERGDTSTAIKIHLAICAEAEAQQNTRLVALAANNLSMQFEQLGETDRALEYARKALPLLQQLGSRVHLVKLQLAIGNLLRKQGKRAEATLEAYRQALTDATELGMRGDVAAIHLVVADLLLEAGHEAQAEWEIRAALPIIDEEKMVPEGIAALSLLRDSLRRRKIDKQALRDLHGYFQEK